MGLVVDGFDMDHRVGHDRQLSLNPLRDRMADLVGLGQRQVPINVDGHIQ